MPERRITVASKIGLHARPAALVAKAAAARSIPITIRKDQTESVDAGSILGLMTLGAEHGDEVVISADGEGAETALDHLVELVGSDLDSD